LLQTKDLPVFGWMETLKFASKNAMFLVENAQIEREKRLFAFSERFANHLNSLYTEDSASLRGSRA